MTRKMTAARRLSNGKPNKEPMCGSVHETLKELEEIVMAAVKHSDTDSVAAVDFWSSNPTTKHFEI